jgi:malate dehydrogenase (oxaloacetate-decarboxylating)
LQEHLKEMFGVIYTPTEGKAIQNYSRLFRKPAGCFLDVDNPEGIDEAISRWGGPEDIDLVVVSDGEQVGLIQGRLLNHSKPDRSSV